MTTAEIADTGRVDLARRTARAVSGVTQRFMLDGDTYAVGTEAGFAGIDFYFAGRAGVLGDVGGDVVAAALVFFEPATVRAAWAAGRTVWAPAESAAAFAACLSRWGDAHLDDDAVDWPALAELAGRIVAEASPASAPVFAGWRALPVPPAPKHAALHHLNGLRELRMARHGAAVVANGVDPADAMWHRSPKMAPMFGWPERAIDEAVVARWDRAEAMTDDVTGRDYAVLDDGEAARFEELCAATTAAIRR